jgi:DNA-binding transcriptional ArsR family regulator
MFSTKWLTTNWLNMIQDRLSSVFFALADPTRRGVLARLATGDATVKELAEPYDMSVAAVSKHLKVLAAAGLVSEGRQSQWRPRHLEVEPLREVFQWLEDYRRFWDSSLDSLGEHLRTLQLQSAGPKRVHKRRGPTGRAGRKS